MEAGDHVRKKERADDWMVDLNKIDHFQVLIYHQTNHQTESKNPNFHPASHNFSKSFVPRDQF